MVNFFSMIYNKNEYVLLCQQIYANQKGSPPPNGVGSAFPSNGEDPPPPSAEGGRSPFVSEAVTRNTASLFQVAQQQPFDDCATYETTYTVTPTTSRLLRMAVRKNRTAYVHVVINTRGILNLNGTDTPLNVERPSGGCKTRVITEKIFSKIFS